MRYTRRCWANGAIGGILAVLAVIRQDPLLLAGSITVFAVLVGLAGAFVVSARAELDALSTSLTVTPGTVRTDAPVTVTAVATRSSASDRTGGDRQPLEVDWSLPVAAIVEDGDPSVRLGADETRAETTLTVSAPTAGEFTFGPATVQLTDPAGLFHTEAPVESTATLVVDPRTPRTIHVGQGGDRIAAAYGEHTADRGSSGLEPAELRQYVPGDPLSHIEWNATARLGDPHVKEFEAETDRETLLVVDHGGTMGRGQPGETKLDHARELALAVVESAQTLSDPLGLATVGDDGTTSDRSPAATASHYRGVRTQLYDLSPTGAGTQPATTTPNRDPGRLGQRLATDTADFGRKLAPFVRASDPYAKRVERRPLFETVRRMLARQPGVSLAVVVTDDSQRAELRETVRLLRQRGVQVVVYLLPDALYEAGGLTDVEATYDAYVDFESYRRDLSRIEGVTAFEVAPADRLAATLTSGTTGRSTRGGERVP